MGVQSTAKESGKKIKMYTYNKQQQIKLLSEGKKKKNQILQKASQALARFGQSFRRAHLSAK